ncbi:MAG: hypothetical protein B6D64_09695 [Bacteroidetes bacterium 4484_276]|nr:MAG: hypothetical protein B6D64_09695 [Bacteroidetes bacterium 4484_276]OYT12773.1 MAG: hypothetical protein B6I19_08595 [Bacteroidetes bacterium 4572_114]
MRKLTFILVILLAGNFAFGQFSIGPKVGFTTSKLTTDLDSISTDFKSSFQFGAFVRLGKKIYVQPEINYLTIGGVFKDEKSLNPFKQEIEMKSIEIPVILGWRILNFGVGNVRILLGPSATIVMDKKITSKEEEGYIQPIKEADIDDLVWGFNLGGGVDVLMFTLDVRYQMGINDVITDVQNFSMNSRNNMFSVSLGWKIL